MEEMEKVDTSELEVPRLKMFEEMNDEEIWEATKDDRCPNCGANPHEFVYIAYAPEFAWLECCECGTVFCPRSRRVRKIQYVNDKKKGNSILTVPEGPKVVTPKLVLQ